ncbi:MAG TPA: site-2 protease family protein [Armatimonadota bacterium]|jgi:Zn-dependent protease/CBS domain-containing protein
MFLGKGLRIGRIFGVTISLDYSWFIIFALFVFLLGSAYLPVVVPKLPVLWYWVVAVFTSLLFFASVLIHEMSHSLVARRRGIPVNNITLFIFGGVSQMEDEPGTPGSEFSMAIAGPLASIGIAIVFFGLAVLTVLFRSPLLYASFTYLWFINLVLAVFNLIPAFPLDGGRVFRAALWHWMGSLQRATRIASVTGQTFGWILIVLGVSSIFYPPIRAYASIWLALIGWFVVTAARSSYQQVLIKETLSHVPIGDVMNNQVEAVPADINVDHLVTEYFLRESASALPVERNGQLLGMVSVEDVRKLPRELWATTLVSEITPSMEEEQMVHPGDDAWDAANRMSQTNRDRVLVTERGHVEGVVTRGAIIRWLQTHTTWAMGQA